MGRKEKTITDQPPADRVIEDQQRDDAILKLGRKLVAELGAERSTDTLARWMAHDIAELIHRVEHASDVERQTARGACRNAILALWQHRAGAPGRLSQMGTLVGWTRLLRSRNAHSMDHLMGQRRRSVEEEMSESEVCLALASHLQTVAEPLTRAALHIAAQAADPEVKEEATFAALARVESAETKVTRILFGWSDKALSRRDEMVSDIQKSVATFNESAELILRALDQLSADEGANDEQNGVPESANP